MLSYWWKTYAFEILFGLSLMFLIIVFMFNLVTSKKGSYTNHFPLIKKLLSYPQKNNKRSPIRTSKGERECRKVAEKFTRKPFPKARPSFLQNHITSGHNLELDCYNDELRIGIEYNGRQHYHYTPYFHKTKDAFDNMRYRDDLKKRLCHKAGVKLIVVPYTVKDIKSFLEQQLLSILT